MIGKMKKGCGVYLLSDKSIYIQGFFYEETGPGFLNSNVSARISNKLIIEVLGKIVISVLDSTQIIEGKDWDKKEYIANTLKFVNYKNLKTFESSSKYLIIEVVGNVVQISETEYKTDYGGWYSGIPGGTDECQLEEGSICQLIMKKFNI